MDDDGNNKLNLEEFKMGLEETEMEISDDVVNEIFQKFDIDEDGNISLDEFLIGIRVRLLNSSIFDMLFHFRKIRNTCVIIGNNEVNKIIFSH